MKPLGFALVIAAFASIDLASAAELSPYKQRLLIDFIPDSAPPIDPLYALAVKIQRLRDQGGMPPLDRQFGTPGQGLKPPPGQLGPIAPPDPGPTLSVPDSMNPDFPTPPKPQLPEEPAEAIGRCLLDVGLHRLIDGPCMFRSLGADGSFEIATTGHDQYGYPRYFAHVLLLEGKASGYWNEKEFAEHAQTPLGDLTRNGACWVSDTAKVCAWK